MSEDRENFFRDFMLKEADQLLHQIKEESDKTRKFELCENLLEIFEELDIEVQNDHSLWQEIDMDYQDFTY